VLAGFALEHFNLEARISKQNAQSPLDETYMTAPEVLARFKISEMTLFRWLRDDELGFPRPVIINRRRRLFITAQILEFERSRAA
jgi:predicted DNA-binding transcriptional regulator AlpA